MACCGQARQTYSSTTPVRQNTFNAAGRKPIFEYVGATALTVVGPATGRTYRFPHGGARLEIDARDQASVAQVPSVRRIG